MPTNKLFDNVIVPGDQERIIDPYQVRVFKEQTPDSHVFLSRVVNSLYTVFGDNIVLKGLDIPNENVGFTPTDGAFQVNPGMLIQDSTLLKLNSPTTVIFENLCSENAANGRIIVYIRYKYLKTIEEHPFKICVNFIPKHENPIPSKSFVEDTDLTVIGIFKFTKDNNDIITGIEVAEDEKYIDIKLESGIKRFWLYGYGPDSFNLKKYISNLLVGEGAASVIWDDYLESLALVGDIKNPGPNKYYGTNKDAKKGWYDIPFTLDDVYEDNDFFIFTDIMDVKFNGYNYAGLTQFDNDYPDGDMDNVAVALDNSILNPVDNGASYRMSVTSSPDGPDFHKMNFADGISGIDGYYRATFYAKAQGASKIYFSANPEILSELANKEQAVVFDLKDNKSFLYDDYEYNKDYGIKYLSNGWYKCWVTFMVDRPFENTFFGSIGVWNENSPIDGGLSGAQYVGNTAMRVYLYGLQISYRDRYYPFNSDDIRWVGDETVYFSLTNAKSLYSKDYMVIVNNEVVPKDFYTLSKNPITDKVELLFLDDSLRLQEDAVIIVKYLEFTLNPERCKFTALQDTPDTYYRAAKQLVQVNNDENGLWFSNIEDLLLDNVVLLNKFQSIPSTKVFEQDVYILGKLVVASFEEQPIINSAIYDNFIILNRGETGDGVTSLYSGMKIYRGPNWPGAILRFNELNDYWEIGWENSTDFSPILTVANINNFKDQIEIFNTGASRVYTITSTNNQITLTKDDIDHKIFVKLDQVDGTIVLPDINSAKWAHFWIAVIKINPTSKAKLKIYAYSGQHLCYLSNYVTDIELTENEWTNITKNDNVWYAQISGQSNVMDKATYTEYGVVRMATINEIHFPDDSMVDLAINPQGFKEAFDYYMVSYIEKMNQDRLSDRVYDYTGDGNKITFNLDENSTSDPTKYLVFVGGVAQVPYRHYEIEGSTMKFLDPPRNGSHIYIRSSVATDVGQVEYAPRIHTHQMTDVNGLVDVLNKKADISFSHAVLGSFPSEDLIYTRSTAGSEMFTFPDLYSGKPYYIQAYLKGAGGAGSNGHISTDPYYMVHAYKSGVGGGEGELAITRLKVSPGQSLTLTVGSGGDSIPPNSPGLPEGSAGNALLTLGSEKYSTGTGCFIVINSVSGVTGSTPIRYAFAIGTNLSVNYANCQKLDITGSLVYPYKIADVSGANSNFLYATTYYVRVGVDFTGGTAPAQMSWSTSAFAVTTIADPTADAGGASLTLSSDSFYSSQHSENKANIKVESVTGVTGNPQYYVFLVGTDPNVSYD